MSEISGKLKEEEIIYDTDSIDNFETCSNRLQITETSQIEPSANTCVCVCVCVMTCIYNRICCGGI